MTFDVFKIYTSANADELKVGSKVIVADDLSSLRTRVNCEKDWVFTLKKIWGTSNKDRFEISTGGRFNLCYLVSEPVEEKLKWTELKLGDVITDGRTGLEFLITGIDKSEHCSVHIFVQDYWIDDKELEDYWKKVE